MLAWIVLFDPPLYMGMAIIKAGQKYVGELFWCSTELSMVHKLAWVVNKLAQAGTQVVQPSF